VFPLRAQKGGVLARRGHTEGTVDLAVLAGLAPAGVLCELMNPDGTMARGKQVDDFAKLHNLPVLSIAELVAFRESLAVARERCAEPA
jgi:3,4-dihydroxy 2-butanone 4-phosphate synthase